MTLKELRKSLGLTQIEFGERFGGIPRRTLQGWESGDRVPPPGKSSLTPKTAQNLAKYGQLRSVKTHKAP